MSGSLPVVHIPWTLLGGGMMETGLGGADKGAIVEAGQKLILVLFFAQPRGRYTMRDLER